MPKIVALLLPLLIGLSFTSHAQVYKSTDDDGNVVFSDTPADGGEEIQVPRANVADPVEAPAPAPSEPKPKPEVVVEETPQPEVIVIDDDDDDGDIGMRQKHRRAKHRRNAER
jgi:hypothetical protein